MQVEITLVNKTENYRFNSYVENWTCDNFSQVYKEAQAQFGRCISKVYIDQNKIPKAIGWVFTKKVKYDDCEKQYVQEAWIVPIKTIFGMLA